MVKRTYNKDRSYREDRSPDLRFSKMSQRSRSRFPARDKCDNRDKRHGFYIKGVVGGAASHQLSVTSLASNYNIVAAGDKSNNNTHKDPGSAPHTELGSDQRAKLLH